MFIAAALLLTAAQDFRFAIVGDRTGTHAPGVFEAVWKETAAYQPAFAIHIGDWIEGGDEAKAEAEWKSLATVNAGVATYFVAGNHDIWNERSRKLFEKYTGRKATYAFQHQGALFVVLDNAQSLELPEDQWAFLERALESHKTSTPKFVLFHQPGWVFPVLLRQTDFRLHQLAKKHGVAAVISGHTHQYLRRELEGVTYLTVCSAGGRLRGKNFEDGFFYGYTQVQVAGGRVRIVTQELGAPHGKGRRLALD